MIKQTFLLFLLLFIVSNSLKASDPGGPEVRTCPYCQDPSVILRAPRGTPSIAESLTITLPYLLNNPSEINLCPWCLLPRAHFYHHPTDTAKSLLKKPQLDITQQEQQLFKQYHFDFQKDASLDFKKLLWVRTFYLHSQKSLHHSTYHSEQLFSYTLNKPGPMWKALNQIYKEQFIHSLQQSHDAPKATSESKLYNLYKKSLVHAVAQEYDLAIKSLNTILNNTTEYKTDREQYLQSYIAHSKQSIALYTHQKLIADKFIDLTPEALVKLIITPLPEKQPNNIDHKRWAEHHIALSLLTDLATERNQAANNALWKIINKNITQLNTHISAEQIDKLYYSHERWKKWYTELNTANLKLKKNTNEDKYRFNNLVNSTHINTAQRWSAEYRLNQRQSTKDLTSSSSSQILLLTRYININHLATENKDFYAESLLNALCELTSLEQISYKEIEALRTIAELRELIQPQLQQSYSQKKSKLDYIHQAIGSILGDQKILNQWIKDPQVINNDNYLKARKAHWHVIAALKNPIRKDTCLDIINNKDEQIPDAIIRYAFSLNLSKVDSKLKKRCLKQLKQGHLTFEADVLQQHFIIKHINKLPLNVIK